MAKRWLALVLSCIMILTLCSVTWASEEPVTGELGDNVTWSLDVETGELTISGTGPMWNFDDDENMTPLWDWYDYITSVVIQSGVTTIGEYAFPMCTGLVSVSIPDSVVSIGDYAFCMCISLESVSIPDSVTAIGALAFAQCVSLASVNIPASVTSIGEQAFLTCTSLASVSIPASVTEIGYAAFSACSSLGGITVAAENLQYCSDSDGVLFNKDKTVLIQYPVGKTAESYTVPASVIIIDAFAFSACESLESVMIPAGVEEIYDCAFCYCFNLTSVNIPASVTYIGESVFDCGEDEEEKPLPLELQDIYYGGSAEDWEKIKIAASNILNDVTIHYNWTDLDGDGEENGVDLTLLARHIAGIELLSKEQEALADVNGKDSVSAGDLTTLARNLLS